MQTNKKDVTQSPQTLHHSERGDLNTISPKLVNQTPTINPKTPKSEPATTTVKLHETTRQDLKTHSSDMTSVGPQKLQSQRSESALLSTKTTQLSFLSSKPSIQTKARTSNMSGSKENFECKDLSGISGSKSSSNSKGLTASKDSPDVKTGSDSKPKDSQDSKSGTASKTNSGSKDSLDSKTGLDSKSCPISKSRDSLESKTDTGSKSVMRSDDVLDPKNLKTSPSCKPGSELKLSSNSDLSSCKPGLTPSTSKASLLASGSGTSISPSSSRTGLSGSKDNHLKNTGTSVKPGSDLKTSSDSKSAVADSSASLTISPRPGSASRSSGSGPGKGLSCETSKDVQRSPIFAPGNLVLWF